MEWSNDDALDLIEQYRYHTELWNRADPKYKDKLCRFRAWSEIAENFGCSKAEVERKMNVLLTQYRREKHKMLVKLYQGIQPNPSKWYAFKRFDFMEAGGGSASNIVGGGSNGLSSNTGRINSDIVNGHATAAAAAAALVNGLTVGYDSVTGAATIATTTSIATASATLTPTPRLTLTPTPSATSTPTLTSVSGHRRIKSKEMKYFGAMGLNLPILIANSQTLDTWNTVGQYSPPINDRSQLRAPLSMPFPTAHSELNVSAAATRNLFGPGAGGGSSNNSDMTASPQKPMETSDIDEKEEFNPKMEHNASSPNHSNTHPQNLDTDGDGIPLNNSSSSTGGGGGGGGGGPSIGVVIVGGASTGSGGGVGGGGGGINNNNGNERTANIGSTSVISSSAAVGNLIGIDGNGSSPVRVASTNLHPAHASRRHISRDQEELDIKLELVDYFNAPHPPAPPNSHRSYSSTDENRLGGIDSDVDYAQDLRIITPSNTVVGKSLDFSQFVLPLNLRHSTDSIEEKFGPLNMRKMHSAGVSGAAGGGGGGGGNNVDNNNGASAGQLLMNSLLSSNESMSADDTNASVRGLKNTSQESASAAAAAAAASTSAAAAAAALYAESFNRDDCDHIGSNVTHKLRSMDRTQRIIAEKLISEVLFYGQFNELERTARIQPK